MRDAILSFRAKGKMTVAWSDSFEGNSDYALATACQFVFVQPSGNVWLTGLNFEVQFVGGLLRRWGIKPQLFGREEFKSAKNYYTETKMSPAQRLNMRSIAASLFGQLTDVIGRARNVSEPVLRQIIDRAPLTAEEGLTWGLIDSVLYREGVQAAVHDLIKSPATQCKTVHPASREGGQVVSSPGGGRGGLLVVKLGAVGWGGGGWGAAARRRGLDGAAVGRVGEEILNISWAGEGEIVVRFSGGREQRDGWVLYLLSCIAHVEERGQATAHLQASGLPPTWAIAGRRKGEAGKRGRPAFLYLHKYAER